jgi:hypothetical protein
LNVCAPAGAAFARIYTRVRESWGTYVKSNRGCGLGARNTVVGEGPKLPRLHFLYIPPLRRTTPQCACCFHHNHETPPGPLHHPPHPRASMSQNDLFLNLLRPAVLHILRATGFQHGKPSAVDTIVDLTARYLSLLAERTAYNAFSNHNDLIPDITDVRMAMQDCALLVPTVTAGEELWKEILRKPLEEYNADAGAREEEEERRDAEDTADVTEFIEWVTGDQNKEIRRIAGTYKPVPTNPTEQLDQMEMEDYLNSMFNSRVRQLATC